MQGSQSRSWDSTTSRHINWNAVLVRLFVADISGCAQFRAAAPLRRVRPGAGMLMTGLGWMPGLTKRRPGDGTGDDVGPAFRPRF
jgi:hypothetical protein